LLEWNFRGCLIDWDIFGGSDIVPSLALALVSVPLCFSFLIRGAVSTKHQYKNREWEKEWRSPGPVFVEEFGAALNFCSGSGVREALFTGSSSLSSC
jgi:hypothetical protein